MIAVLVTADSRYRVDRKHIRSIVAKFLADQGLRDNYEVSLSIVGNRKMKRLSREFLGKEEDHDVLSFPFQDSQNHELFAYPPDQIIRLGEIIVCHPQIVADAAKSNVLVKDKMAQMIEHSILHLLGQHHEE